MEQIYGLLMGTRAFMYLGDMDFLVAQMIHFVEDLPEEWRPQWEEMQKSTGRIRDDIPGMASSSRRGFSGG
jgi:hypothetical protein